LDDLRLLLAGNDLELGMIVYAVASEDVQQAVVVVIDP